MAQIYQILEIISIIGLVIAVILHTIACSAENKLTAKQLLTLYKITIVIFVIFILSYLSIFFLKRNYADSKRYEYDIYAYNTKVDADSVNFYKIRSFTIDDDNKSIYIKY